MRPNHQLDNTAAVIARYAVTCVVLLLMACGSDPISPQEITVEDVIEALFLGTGRANAGGGCAEDPGGPHIEGLWRTFAAGSDIELVIGSSVAELGREALVREMALINALVGSFFSISIVDTPLADPLPSAGQITSADFGGSVVASICDGNSQGCAIPTEISGPAYVSVRTVQGLQFPGVSHVHEVGHALGLCHVNGASLPSAVMANPQQGDAQRFVELERLAIQRVFASGLSPGATHAEFRSAGLIR